MYLNRKQLISLTVVSLFILSLSAIIYSLRPYTESENKHQSNTPAALLGDISFSNLVSEEDIPLHGTISISDKFATSILNAYIDNLTVNKSFNLDLSINNDHFKVKTYFTILKIKTSAKFDLNIINPEGNKFKLIISNLSVGKLNLDNKVFQSIIGNSLKDKPNIQHKDSNIYIDIDLSEKLKSIEIENFSIDNSKTSFDFKFI